MFLQQFKSEHQITSLEEGRNWLREKLCYDHLCFNSVKVLRSHHILIIAPIAKDLLSFINIAFFSISYCIRLLQEAGKQETKQRSLALESGALSQVPCKPGGGEGTKSWSRGETLKVRGHVFLLFIAWFHAVNVGFPESWEGDSYLFPWLG